MPTDLAALTAGLRGLGPVRVWSLMVSLFGDLARGEGEAIDGPVLSAIMSALDVRPEAVRVALHRLRNDGWIASDKHGRIGRHRLTAQGRAESAAASPRIYARPADMPRDWQLAILPHDDDLPGHAPLLPRVWCGPRAAPVPADALVLAGGAAPDWLRAALMPAERAADYAALDAALAALEPHLPPPAELSAVDTAALRCLVVHNWRRLVLRHPALPRALLPPDAPMVRCHARVDALLARYDRPDPAALSSR